jgi:hypothetical protein
MEGELYLIVRIDKKVFDSLPVDAVGHACFAPMVPVYQGGMRQQHAQGVYEYRAEFYKSLSQGQQALLGFFTYYDHAINSNEEFHRISNQYISQHIFGIVKKGAEYFTDNDMCQLLLRIEQAIITNDKYDIINLSLDELYKELCQIAPCTLTRIGTCIKENPEKFICFD